MLSLGEETPVTIDGKTWTVGRCELKQIKKFRNYIAGIIGDPFALVERYIDKMPKEWVLAEMEKAKEIQQQLESFAIQSPLAKRFMASEGGMSFLMQQLLLKAHPTATEDDAFMVLQHLGKEETAKALARAHGEIPLKNDQASGNQTSPTK